ncbi:MAG: hypothetical protein ACI9XO_001743 [Paraglaciecola sp.]|jgi:hypothetical protein
MRHFLIVFLMGISGALFGQNVDKMLDSVIVKSEVEAHLRYLASDELMGRDVGKPGGDTAAVYIAREFEKYGLKQVAGADGWFQKVPFQMVTPAQSGELIFGKHKYDIGNKLLIINGKAIDTQAAAVFAGHGWVNAETGHNDYENLDVEGKIVFVLPGNPESNHPFSAFEVMGDKQKIAAEHGAIALIELFRLNFPWNYFKSFINKEKLSIATDNENANSLIYGWLKEESKESIAALADGKKMRARLISSGTKSKPLFSNNVIGMIAGTNPDLQDEYVIMTAHYDHIGVDKNAEVGQDSIFNGARDNGMGVVALLSAAKALAAKPAVRPTLFLAVTAEEKGLLGSKYYVDNPLIPLEKTIFNLNNDGGGYNSTEHVAIIGYGRTGTDAQIQASVENLGLKVAENPMPDENLFDRSDNVNFALKGVPSIDYAPGALSFDVEVTKYYHQVPDEAGSIDYDYLLRFCQAYARAARLISDKENVPIWTEGDKYEAAGKRLYGKE